MVGSVQRRLVYWFADSLESVLKLDSKDCIYDSVTFANMIHNTSINPNNFFLCSFDISNLRTSVPLDETTALYNDALYRSHLEPAPLFPETVLFELMDMASKCVQFSFNNTMYRHISEQ